METAEVIKNDTTTDSDLLYINERPVWGPESYSLKDMIQLRDRIIQKMATLAESGGAILLPFDKLAERSVCMFLNMLSGKLIDQDHHISNTQFLGYPFLELPVSSIHIWRIHQAPLFQNLPMMLENWVRPGNVAILSGERFLFQKLQFTIPVHMVSSFERSDHLFESDLSQALSKAMDDMKNDTFIQKMHHLVCLCDSWGVPLSLDFLANLTKTETDDLAPILERAYENELLFWIERDKPPGLLIASVSESYARLYLKRLAGKNQVSFADYKSIFDTIDCQVKEERYIALKLIQSFMANSRMRHELWNDTFSLAQIRQWIVDRWDFFEHLIQSGNSIEHLIWSQCLSRLSLFSQAHDILSAALMKYPDNVFLNQYHAHCLALWSMVSSSKIKLAQQAFAKATRLCENNIYLWQSRGIFEARYGSFSGAQLCFESALSINPKSVHTFVARSHMFLDFCDFVQAEKDLDAAANIDPDNPYVMHLSGRLAFYKGKWQTAERFWKNMLIHNTQNVYALQSLGNMARERGHFEDAAMYLNNAIDVDPENVSVYQELAMVMQKKGEYKKISGHSPDEYFSQALAFFQQAEKMAPENCHVIVGMAELYRLMGQTEKTHEYLDPFIKSCPDNLYALKTLALCHEDQHDTELFKKRLKQILSIQKKSKFSIFAYMCFANACIKKNERDQALHYFKQSDRILKTVQFPAHETIQIHIEKFHLLKKLCLDEEAQLIMKQIKTIDENHIFVKTFEVQP
jgi:tetratricopeptide (TPR) repeat protein